MGRGQECGGVRTEGVERDVAQVEQAGEADDDVQADRHDREDQHEHDDRAARQRQGRGMDDGIAW